MELLKSELISIVWRVPSRLRRRIIRRFLTIESRVSDFRKVCGYERDMAKAMETSVEGLGPECLASDCAGIDSPHPQAVLATETVRDAVCLPSN